MGTESDKSGEIPNGDQLQTVPKAEYDKIVGQLGGLRGHIDTQLKPELEKFKKDLADAAVERAKVETDLKSELTLHKSTAERIAAEKQALEAEVAVLRHQQQVGVLINSKFPELTAAFGAGILRTQGLEGEALETYLQNTLNFVKGTGVQAVNTLLQGTVPPNPGMLGVQPGGASLTADQMHEQLMQMTPNTPQYNQLFAAWMEAEKKRQAK